MMKLTTLAMALGVMTLAPAQAAGPQADFKKPVKQTPTITADVPSIRAADLGTKTSIGLFEKVDNMRSVPVYLADPANTISVQGDTAFVQAPRTTIEQSQPGLWAGDVVRHALQGDYASVSGNLIIIAGEHLETVLAQHQLKLLKEFANGTALVAPLQAVELTELNKALKSSPLVKASKLEILGKRVEAF
ncbi:hypothetical protein [Pseudoalteromonas sp. T1lg75]|nr:hypothetical protein [Pseudoalteromonas sp. T1lg75]